MTRHCTRRFFLGTTTAAGVVAATSNCWPIASAADESNPASLERAIGITTGGLNYQRENFILTAMTLPRFVRDELGMRLIDLNTRWLTSFEHGYVRRVRQVVDDAGCYITNLKVNHAFGDLYSDDPRERRESLAHGREMIQVAKLLGARWIRFSVSKVLADKTKDPLAHRALAEDAQEHGIQLVIENGGWMASDPDSVRRLVTKIGKNAAPAPDTGNWSDEVRYQALANSCVGAVTCDFKVYDLDNDNAHAKYDIKRCFEVAWNANFRGPWAIEHWNTDLKLFAKETIFLRDQLKQWMEETA